MIELYDISSLLLYDNLTNLRRGIDMQWCKSYKTGNVRR